jgi:hypothetical protein
MGTRDIDLKERKSKLIQRCANFIASDLILDEAKKEEIFARLQLKLGIQKEELLKLVKEP